MSLSEIAKGIFRLKVPFEDLYTAVFFVACDSGWAVIDCATTDDDVDTHILPAMRRLDGEVTHLLLTHSHGDHAGGAKHLLERCPSMCAYALESMESTRFGRLKDGDLILGRLQVVYLPGHTRYSVGYLDTVTRTILTGDCLQLAGVGKYTKGIQYPEQYLQSIEKLKAMELDRIVASHDYVPLGSIAEGKDAVLAYLDECQRICLSLIQ